MALYYITDGVPEYITTSDNIRIRQSRFVREMTLPPGYYRYIIYSPNGCRAAGYFSLYEYTHAYFRGDSSEFGDVAYLRLHADVPECTLLYAGSEFEEFGPIWGWDKNANYPKSQLTDSERLSSFTITTITGGYSYGYLAIWFQERYPLNFVYDRTAEDVSKLRNLTKKKWKDLTAKEQREWNRPNKGACNAVDMNRIHYNLQYAYEELTKYGIAINWSSWPEINHVDWASIDGEDITVEWSDVWYTGNDYVLNTVMNNYRTKLQSLRGAISVLQDTPKPPSTWSAMSYTKLNEIERILSDVNMLIETMAKAWFYCGEISCGEV